jgi:hypothetical protein
MTYGMDLKFWVVMTATVGLLSFIGLDSYSVPNCSDPRTKNLLHRVLVEKFHLADSVSVKNIRTTSGWIFGKSYECGADLTGIDSPEFLGFKTDAVTYTMRKTDDGNFFITAKLEPSLE